MDLIAQFLYQASDGASREMNEGEMNKKPREPKNITSQVIRDRSTVEDSSLGIQIESCSPVKAMQQRTDNDNHVCKL